MDSRIPLDVARLGQLASVHHLLISARAGRARSPHPRSPAPTRPPSAAGTPEPLDTRRRPFALSCSGADDRTLAVHGHGSAHRRGGCKPATVRQGRVRRLSGMRHPRPWLLATALRRLRLRQARRLLLQAPRVLPFVRRPAHGADRRPPDRSRHPARADPAASRRARSTGAFTPASCGPSSRRCRTVRSWRRRSCGGASAIRMPR